MSRVKTLVNMYEVFKKVGVHFTIKGSSGYGFSAMSDDMGYFFYSIILASRLRLPILKAGSVFFNLSLAVSFFIISASFFFMKRSYLNYSIIILGLLRLLMPLIYLNHPYIAYVLGVSPIALVLLADSCDSNSLFMMSALVGGIIASIADNVRMLSALPLLIFYGVYLLLSHKQSLKQKIIFITLFLVAYSIPYFHYKYCLKNRDVFLIQQGVVPPERAKHVFWHNIYTGLGFLHNKENIIWNDTCAANKALKINSKAIYPSSLYEKTIRNEIFRLCKEKRYFVATTVFSKLGVILYFFLLYFGYIGLLCSYFYPKSWFIELAFWAALGVSALPGVLTLPVTAYLIGFITVTIIYTLYSLLYALKRGVLKDIKTGIGTFIERIKNAKNII